MNLREIERLGPEAFARECKPLKRFPHKLRDWPVIALDTEFTRRGKLVSWQVADETGGKLMPAHSTPLTVDALADETRRIRGTRRDVVVVTYFSLAELQFLPVFAEAMQIREYAGGSLDCTLEASCGTRLHVYDVARFFDRLSMRAAAKDLGLDQGKLEYDVTNVTRASLRDPEFVAYSIRDAEVTLQLFERVRDAWALEGVDVLRTRTPAACSAARFRGAYLRESYGVPAPAVRRLTLRAAWGGRAEAFARGSWDHVREYDISSAYPSAAIKLRLMPRARDWRSLREPKHLNRYAGGFARVGFRFKRGERFPCLPVFEEGVLLYPREGHSYCTLHELRLARRMGARVTLYDGYCYRTGSSALADMMEDVRARRAGAADPATRRVLKLQMNALIGKFIQHRTTPGPSDLETLARQLGIPVDAFAGLRRAELEALGWEAAFRIGSCWAPEVNALITGFVRAQLSTMIVRTQPVYCATDAVWTLRALDEVPDGWELKREGPALVARTRLGLLDGKVVHHAWSRREEARAALEAGEDARRYTHNRPLHFIQALERRVPVGTWVSEERMGTTGWDGKRRLLLDGTSEPWDDVDTWRASRRGEAG